MLENTTKGMKLFPFILSNEQVNTRKSINNSPFYSINLLFNPITFPITFFFGLINASKSTPPPKFWYENQILTATIASSRFIAKGLAARGWRFVLVAVVVSSPEIRDRRVSSVIFLLRFLIISGDSPRTWVGGHCDYRVVSPSNFSMGLTVMVAMFFGPLHRKFVKSMSNFRLSCHSEINRWRRWEGWFPSTACICRWRRLLSSEIISSSVPKTTW